MMPGAGERNHFQPRPRSLEIRRCGKIIFDLLLIVVDFLGGAASKSSPATELEKRRPSKQHAQECQVNRWRGNCGLVVAAPAAQFQNKKEGRASYVLKNIKREGSIIITVAFLPSWSKSIPNFSPVRRDAEH